VLTLHLAAKNVFGLLVERICAESSDAETVRGTVPGLELRDECSAEPSIGKAL
jgi:hypothetical protein